MVLDKVFTGFNYDFRSNKDDWYGVENSDKIKRKKLFEYLESVDMGIKKSGDFFTVVPKPSRVSTGLIMLYGDGQFRDKAIRYIFSPDRKFSPTHISCSDKQYDLVEDILKRERGGSAYLSKGVFEWMFGSRIIEYGNIKS